MQCRRNGRSLCGSCLPPTSSEVFCLPFLTSCQPASENQLVDIACSSRNICPCHHLARKQLCPTFTAICQLSLTQLRVPCSCSKWSAERLVASSRCEALTDYRMLVLASVVMKSWARPGKKELLAKTEHLHDPFPSTLRPNRMSSSVNLLDLMFKHLEGIANHSEPCLVDFIDQLFSRINRSTSCVFIVYFVKL